MLLSAGAAVLPQEVVADVGWSAGGLSRASGVAEHSGPLSWPGVGTLLLLAGCTCRGFGFGFNRELTDNGGVS
jgi:hypothetical protein